MHVFTICMSHEFVKYAHIIKYHIPYVLPLCEEVFLHIFFLNPENPSYWYTPSP